MKYALRPEYNIAQRAALGMLLLCAVSSAHALLLIDAGANSSEGLFSPGNYAAGTEFRTTGNIEIDGLGYIDIGSNGLTENHRVGLWDAGTQALLAEAVVTNASTVVASASALGRWLVQAITPIVIGPGTYRVAGLVGNEANSLSNDRVGNGVTLANGYVRTDFPNGGFNFPNLSFGSQAIRATVTSGQFRQDPPVTVPEPTVLALTMLGLGGIGAVRRARRARRG